MCSQDGNIHSTQEMALASIFPLLMAKIQTVLISIIFFSMQKYTSRDTAAGSLNQLS